MPVISIDALEWQQMQIEIQFLKSRVTELETKLRVSEKTKQVVLDQNFTLQQALGLNHVASIHATKP